MNNQDIYEQFKEVKDAAAQIRLSGVVYLDTDPEKGSLRLKFKVAPAEQQSKLVSSLAYVITQISQAFGLQVNTREAKNEEVNNG